MTPWYSLRIRLWRISYPIFPLCRDAPTTAIDRGEKIASSSGRICRAILEPLINLGYLPQAAVIAFDNGVLRIIYRQGDGPAHRPSAGTAQGVGARHAEFLRPPSVEDVRDRLARRPRRVRRPRLPRARRLRGDDLQGGADRAGGGLARGEHVHPDRPRDGARRSGADDPARGGREGRPSAGPLRRGAAHRGRPPGEP